MNETEVSIIITVISIIVGLVTLFFGSKIIYKKYVGRDDSSIKIKKSKIKNSFNGKR